MPGFTYPYPNFSFLGVSLGRGALSHVIHCNPLPPFGTYFSKIQGIGLFFSAKPRAERLVLSGTVGVCQIWAMQSIQLLDALRLMEARDRNGVQIPFDISYYKYDPRAKSGNGTIKELPGAVILTKASLKAKSKSLQNGKYAYRKSKPPNHQQNGTRNLTIPGTDQVYKVNIFLIREINGMPVTQLRK